MINQQKIKFRKSSLEPGDNTPFEHCKLGREEYADQITKIIKISEGGFVMSINNSWGFGKTSFLKMWQKKLEIKEEYKTIYLNVWEKDLHSEPLLTIISELNNFCEFDEKSMKQLVKVIIPLLKSSFPALGKAIAKNLIEKHLTGDLKELTSETVQKSVDEIGDEIASMMKEYSKREKNITAFTEKVENQIHQKSPDKPVVFIIDELDRCKPSYAVSILEVIKHFFCIENIIFVLSIDRVQLGNAIKGYYGNQDIDANEYLRKFIDIEFSIPEPTAENYHIHLLERYGYAAYLDISRTNNPIANEAKELYSISLLLFKGNVVPLRLQESIYLNYYLYNLTNKDDSTLPYLSFLLNFIKYTDEEIWNMLKKAEKSDMNKCLEAVRAILFRNTSTTQYQYMIIIDLIITQKLGEHFIGKDYICLTKDIATSKTLLNKKDLTYPNHDKTYWEQYDNLNNNFRFNQAQIFDLIKSIDLYS